MSLSSLSSSIVVDDVIVVFDVLRLLPPPPLSSNETERRTSSRFDLESDEFWEKKIFASLNELDLRGWDVISLRGPDPIKPFQLQIMLS